jgi:hypothetical protein
MGTSDSEKRHLDILDAAANTFTTLYRVHAEQTEILSDYQP